MSNLLSKTSFIHFLESPFFLWLEKVRPDLMPEQGAGLQHVFDQGNDADDLARGLYPGGYDVDAYNEEGAKNTWDAIAMGAKILYQPTAVARGLSARADILTKGRGDTWDMHEVKSGLDVKDKYVMDVAFQRHCFELAGIHIGKTFITLIDRNFTRDGAIDAHSLFVEQDVTSKALLMVPKVKRLIPAAKRVLGWPKTLTAVHLRTCEDLAEDEWVGCWLDSLKPKAREKILRGIKADAATELLEEELVESRGLSAEFLKSIGYRTPSKRWPLRVDKEKIRGALDGLKYPLHFFDYETLFVAVPPFDGYRPYQQIPFQFSVLVLDRKGATPKKHDFLMETFEDPSRQIVAALAKVIGRKGSVIAWNASFEKSRNKELATKYPKYKKLLLGINERTFDLLTPFRKGYFSNSDIDGDRSIKNVLPALCPGYSYADLNIHEGGTASASWPILTDPKLPKAQRRKLRKDMIDYCRLDVLGMVKILDFLRKAAA